MIWDNVSHVIRGLTGRDDTAPGQTSGTFTAHTPADVEALRHCLEAARDTRIEIDDVERAEQIVQGQTYTLSMFPRMGLGVLARTLQQLLEVPGARVKRPSNFYILTRDMSSVDAVQPNSLVVRYLAVLDFIEILKSVAAFLDVDEQRLVFVDKRKFEVPVNYDAKHLEQLNLDAVGKISACIPEDRHRDECKIILAKAVVEQTSTVLIGDRFAELLIQAGDLKVRFDEGYRLFTSGFSYEKVRDEVEAVRIEYAGKIHKVIGDIQNQLLGIPIATIVVATQMKDAQKYDSQYWINAAVLLGCLVFAALVLMLLRNQSQTLKVIDAEIARQKKLIDTKYSAVSGTFNDTFVYLTQRADHQRLIIRVIDYVVFAGLAMSVLVFWMLLN